ncbi:uncharacterized protein [Palaemon carinicauda]|uniref:uncharacterized protein n=1 Tax=Palaemon carinicauda TaxID=392227 RepID=UPI0035B669D4
MHPQPLHRSPTHQVPVKSPAAPNRSPTHLRSLTRLRLPARHHSPTCQCSPVRQHSPVPQRSPTLASTLQHESAHKHASALLHTSAPVLLSLLVLSCVPVLSGSPKLYSASALSSSPVLSCISVLSGSPALSGSPVLSCISVLSGLPALSSAPALLRASSHQRSLTHQHLPARQHSPSCKQNKTHQLLRSHAIKRTGRNEKSEADSCEAFEADPSWLSSQTLSHLTSAPHEGLMSSLPPSEEDSPHAKSSPPSVETRKDNINRPLMLEFYLLPRKELKDSKTLAKSSTRTTRPTGSISHSRDVHDPSRDELSGVEEGDLAASHTSEREQKESEHAFWQILTLVRVLNGFADPKLLPPPCVQQRRYYEVLDQPRPALLLHHSLEELTKGVSLERLSNSQVSFSAVEILNQEKVTNTLSLHQSVCPSVILGTQDRHPSPLLSGRLANYNKLGGNLSSTPRQISEALPRSGDHSKPREVFPASHAKIGIPRHNIYQSPQSHPLRRQPTLSQTRRTPSPDVATSPQAPIVSGSSSSQRSPQDSISPVATQVQVESNL